MRKLSRPSARRLALRAQGLDRAWRPGRGKEAAARTVERLGYVQIDTISVVQRAHEHVLWARAPGYRPEYLDELLARDRRVFEYWAHAAAYLPFTDFRYYLPRMRGAAGWRRNREWRARNESFVQRVLDRVRAEGALGSADFEHQPGDRGAWWGWKPAKMALETLYNTGELMVTARRGFQRLYDLPERVIPPGTVTAEPTGEEQVRHFTRRALASLGVATARQLGKPFGNRRADEALPQMVAEGEAVEVAVEGLEEPHYAEPQALERLPRPRHRDVHLLCPFDNLVIDRPRLRQLFGFDYSLECYTPSAKRRHGYYVLPVLWGDELVGRLDPKAERRERVLRVLRLSFEPDFSDYEALLPPLASRLWAYAAFNGCDEVAVESTEPRQIRAALVRALRQRD
ncbi:MAG: crosslink repair DNA glycosylase YcaQ family protein [Gemmatimonadota bacterium]